MELGDGRRPNESIDDGADMTPPHGSTHEAYHRAGKGATVEIDRVGPSRSDVGCDDGPPPSKTSREYGAVLVPTDWLKLVAELDFSPAEPAQEAAIRAAENALTHRLSGALGELCSQTNGLFDEWGYAYVLPVEELPRRRSELRRPWAASFASFDDLFVIGQLGNGDLLTHPVDQHGPAETVVVWEHEDDTRLFYASNLVEALKRLSGGSPPGK